MKIFLSYSSSDRDQAEQICLALEGRGHEVFFDRDDLKGGQDYNAVIQQQIEDATIMVFLISPMSVREGAYSLTELRFAREKWNHPKGRVLPVLVAPTPWAEIPAYLESVTVLEPEGNIAAEVAARVAATRAAPGRLIIAAGLLAIVAAIAIGVHLLGQRAEAPWQSTIEAGDFVSRSVYPADAVNRSEYALDPTFGITANPDSLLYVTRWAYGSVRDSVPAMSITIRFRNVTPGPLQLDFDHRFFTLHDDQGRPGTLLYFCCASGPELLSVGAEREMQLIFAANPGWSGKEVQAHRIHFRINGLLPLTTGVWSVPALATAASP